MKRIKNLTKQRYDQIKVSLNVLHGEHGMSYREVSKILQVSDSTLYVVNRFDSFEAYKEHERTRLAESKARLARENHVTPVSQTTDTIEIKLTLTHDQYNSIVSLLRSVEFNTRKE